MNSLRIPVLGPNTAAEQRAQDWKDEHTDCDFCGREFHLDELTTVDGEDACAECCAFMVWEEMRGAA